MKKGAGAQRYFVVEGNIGSGKSTFLKMLNQYLNIQIVFEPLEQWQNVIEGEDLLDYFYTDPKRWAYTFQSYAFVSRVMTQQSYARTNPYAVQVLERSVFSDRYCFALNCYELGYMSALEWKLYQEWFSWLIDTYMARPDGFIYLQTNPKVCYERRRKRDRQSERQVTLEYLEGIHHKHERWLLKKEGVHDALKDVPVLVLPCDNDFEHNRAEQETHVERVGAFILSQMPVSSNSPSISSLYS